MAKAKRKRKQRTVPAIELVAPTPEQMVKGDAERDFVTHAETATKAMAHRVAHDPVERWYRDGKLSDTQLTTIHRMQEIWDVVHGEAKMTASYTEPSGCVSGDSGGMRCQERVLSLSKALCAVEDAFAGVRSWYFEFEQVCRFGIRPVDASGNRERSLTVVRFVADFIAAKGLV